MRTVDFNGIKIEYNLIRKRVKNLNLRIKPDGSVNVSAPSFVSVSSIDSFVISNAEKIINAKERFIEKKEKEPKYLNGDTVSLLGKKYCLLVSESEKSYYSLENDCVNLYLKNTDDYEQRKALFFCLCRDLAERVFPEVIIECYSDFSDVCKSVPQLKIRNMKSQWGNCRPQKNIITLSLRLVQYSRETISFVVKHEFCHFYEANHSRAFYSQLDKVMPEWKKYDSELKGK